MIDPTIIVPDFLKWSKGEDAEISVTNIHGSVYKFEIKKGRKKLIIKNTTHLLGDNIENLSKIAEMQYTYIPYWSITLNNEDKLEQIRRNFFTKWFENIEPGEFNNTAISTSEKKIKTILIALKENTKVISKLMNIYAKRLNRLSNLWKFKLSIASVTVEIFEKKFNTFKLNLNNQIELDETLRQAYFGGRCEVFGNPYKGEERIRHMDFKNMYGEIMKLSFPTGKLNLVIGPKDWKQPGFYFIETYSECTMPVLPCKGRIDPNSLLEEDLIFVNGWIEGMYFSEEIELFEKTGGKVLKINYAYIFTGENKYLFRELAEFITNERENDKKFPWKKLLVSFYGRLGMRPKKSYSLLIHKSEYHLIEKKKIISENWINGYCFAELEKTVKNVNSKIEYAAIITSRARIKLYKTLIKVRKEGGRLLYCDTDSVFAAYNINHNVESKINWGKKKIIDAVFASSRCYSLQFEDSWETKIAGTVRNSINFEDFKEKFYSITAQFYDVYNYKESIKNFKNWKTWKEYRILDLHIYKKRKFSKDKKHTKPLTKVNGAYTIWNPKNLI